MLPSAPMDHPVIAALAVVSALPFGWPIIKAFFGSAEDDIEEVTRIPLLAYVGWFPEWTLLKFFWLLVVLAALVVLFFKLYMFLGGLIGLVA